MIKKTMFLLLTLSFGLLIACDIEINKSKLQASNAAAFEHFGWSVSLYDDVMLVGSPYGNTGGDFAGSVSVFRNNGSAWVEETKLLSSDLEPSDFFGGSVSVHGNVAIVGAFSEETGGDFTFF